MPGLLSHSVWLELAKAIGNWQSKFGNVFDNLSDFGLRTTAVFVNPARPGTEQR